MTSPDQPPDPVTVVTPGPGRYLAELRTHLQQRHGITVIRGRGAGAAQSHRRACTNHPSLIAADCARFHAEDDPTFAVWLTAQATVNGHADALAIAAAAGPQNITAAAVTSIETARVTLAGLSWLLHRAAARNLTLPAADSDDIRARIGDLRDLLTAAEAALPER